MTQEATKYLSANAVSQKVQKETGVKVNPRRITDAFNEGRAGDSPLPMGKPPMLPTEVLRAAALKVNLEQAAGNELHPRQQTQVLQGIVAGTAHATGKGNGRAINWGFQRQRMKRSFPRLLEPAKAVAVELTRYQWAVYSTYEEWFKGWEKFAVERGYAVWKDLFKSDGTLLSKIEFLSGRLDRIINGDETDIPRDASKRSQTSASRATCVNPLLPRPGRPVTKASGHETLFPFVTANGELLPLVIICDSDCEDAEQQRVELEPDHERIVAVVGALAHERAVD